MQSQINLLETENLFNHYQFIYHLICDGKSLLARALYSTMPIENKNQFICEFLPNNAPFYNVKKYCDLLIN